MTMRWVNLSDEEEEHWVLLAEGLAPGGIPIVGGFKTALIFGEDGSAIDQGCTIFYRVPEMPLTKFREAVAKTPGLEEYPGDDVTRGHLLAYCSKSSRFYELREHGGTRVRIAVCEGESYEEALRRFEESDEALDIENQLRALVAGGLAPQWLTGKIVKSVK